MALSPVQSALRNPATADAEMAEQTEGTLIMRAIMKISKAEDVRKETELMMKHHANWEEYLMPGPISIAILGELACIAAEQGDFTINKAPPVRGYQYMKHPDSFHASLMQVSNSGWQAFNIAHKNMEGIRLLSLNVPEQIKMTIQTLFQEDVTLIDALLPGQLSTLKSTANECSSLAAAVEDKFNYVICLIGELLEVCMSSKSHYEKGLEETKRALEDLELRKAAAEEAKMKAEEYYNEVRNRVTETFNDYKNAVDDIPTGWNAVLLEITSSIREALTMPFIGIASLFNAEDKQSLPPSDSKSEEQLEKEDDFIALNNICAQSAQITALGNALESLLDDEGNIDMDLLYNKKNHEIKTVWTKNKSQQLLEKITKEDKCRVKNLAMNICQNIMDISDILTQAAESGKQENKKSLKKKMKILLKAIQIFDSRSKLCTCTSPFGPVAPNMAKSQEDVQGDSTMAVKNSLLKIEQTKQMLKLSQEEYQKSFDNLKEQNKDLLDVLKDMRNRETRETDFETAKKMLIKGLEALGRVKQQWEKMVCFFQMISSLIDSCLSQRLMGFIQSAENLPQIPNYSHKDFVRDMIYKQAFNVSNIAHLVHMISDTYTEVSSKYLMDNVSSLGRVLVMQPSDPQFLTLRNDLRKSCDDAQKAIEDTVIKQRREFECSVYARVKKISSELNSVLPEVSEAERKAIEDNVQKGMREITEDEADQFV